MTIYSLDVLVFLLGTSLLFHVQFQLLLPDLYTDFSRGRADSHLLKNFLNFVLNHTIKGFGIVNKSEVDVFLVLSSFSDDPAGDPMDWNG